MIHHLNSSGIPCVKLGRYHRGRSYPKTSLLSSWYLQYIRHESDRWWKIRWLGLFGSGPSQWIESIAKGTMPRVLDRYDSSCKQLGNPLRPGWPSRNGVRTCPGIRVSTGFFRGPLLRFRKVAAVFLIDFSINALVVTKRISSATSWCRSRMERNWILIEPKFPQRW